MTTLPELIRDSLNALGGNLNSSFSGQLSDFLQHQGVNMQQLWKPPVDLIESEEKLLIQMNVAGVDPDSVDVSFFNNSINIQGERKPHPLIEESGAIQRRREVIYGKFERKITLPVSITHQESVTIDLSNGVLTILVDKTLEARNKFSLKIGKSDENSETT